MPKTLPLRTTRRPPATAQAAARALNVAVVGAGIAGITCARTLAQAGHAVTVFEKSRGFGGRMATRSTEFGSFDHGVQYFTVRDARFRQAIDVTAAPVRAWSANAVRVLDSHGRVVESALPHRESHWVATPGMNAMVHHWAAPLDRMHRIHLNTQVTRMTRDALDARRWQLRTEASDGGVHVYGGFDAVLLATPHVQADALLLASNLGTSLREAMAPVRVAPCWTLMIAYAQALQPGMSHLGPQWNAALSTHHRIAWLARESSKPGREPIERWTVQAGAEWSQEHLEDDVARVQAKLLRAFAEITAIHAEPHHAQVHRWRYAKTTTPLGKSHLWDARERIGVCGDWCLGHRVENAFVSGLELALRLC